jgi:glycerol-3-phosphate acyltransferase PlsY
MTNNILLLVPKSVYFYLCVLLSVSIIFFIFVFIVKFSSFSSVSTEDTFTLCLVLAFSLRFLNTLKWILVFFFLFQTMDLCSIISHRSQVIRASPVVQHK